MINHLGHLGSPDEATLTRIAQETVAEIHAAGERLPGYGIPLHTRNPRADRVLEPTKEHRVFDTYCRFAELMGDALKQARGGRAVPLNIVGICGCIALDLGFDWRTTQMFLLNARSVSMGAHYLEEQDQDSIWRQIPADQIDYID